MNLSPRPLLGAIAKRMPFARPFWFLVVGSFINKAGNFVIPFFTLYLTTSMGLSITQTTLIISLMGLGSLAAGICGGVLADMVGRRATLLISLGATGLLMLALGFVRSIPVILLLAIPYQFFNEVFRPATSAVIADVVPPEQRVQAFGLRYWANNLGNAIGPLVAGVVAPISYTLLFVGDAAATLCFAALVWVGIPETGQPRRGAGLPPLRSALADPWLWAYSVLGFVFDCIYVQWSSALPLDMVAHGLGALAYGTVVAVNALMVVAVSIPLLGFFQRRDLHIALGVASLMLGLGMGIYSWMSTYPAYLIGAAIWTVGEILSIPIASVLIAQLSPDQLRASYQGIHSTMRSLSVLVAPALGGLVIDRLGPGALWQICLGLGLLTAGGYLAVGQLRKGDLRRRAAGRSLAS
ncbi:MFS transporter [Chloroflexia bacterium SDU3-3]|nr:MFS transporter [Chloroflexia bacterium SDU3-3]